MASDLKALVQQGEQPIGRLARPPLCTYNQLLALAYCRIAAAIGATRLYAI